MLATRWHGVDHEPDWVADLRDSLHGLAGPLADVHAAGDAWRHANPRPRNLHPGGRWGPSPEVCLHDARFRRVGDQLTELGFETAGGPPPPPIRLPGVADEEWQEQQTAFNSTVHHGAEAWGGCGVFRMAALHRNTGVARPYPVFRFDAYQKDLEIGLHIDWRGDRERGDSGREVALLDSDVSYLALVRRHDPNVRTDAFRTADTIYKAIFQDQQTASKIARKLRTRGVLLLAA